jgi:hypothetical protein
MRYLLLLPLLFILWAIVWPVNTGNGASQTLAEIQALPHPACMPVCQAATTRASILEGKLFFAQTQADLLQYKTMRVNVSRRAAKEDIENPNIGSGN